MTSGVAHSTDGPFDLLLDESDQLPCAERAALCPACAAFLPPADGETWQGWAERLGAREGKTRGRPVT